MISEIKHKTTDRKIFIKLFNKLSAQLLEKVKMVNNGYIFRNF